MTVNGSVSMIEAQARAKDPFPLKMQNQLYRNRGDGHFVDVSADAGEPFKLLDVSRLAALGWKARTPLRAGIAQAYESAPFRAAAPNP